jgi:hypothetical protein
VEVLILLDQLKDILKIYLEVKMKAWIKTIEANIEHLETTEGDSIPCISIEILLGILYDENLITETEKEQIEGGL